VQTFDLLAIFCCAHKTYFRQKIDLSLTNLIELRMFSNTRKRIGEVKVVEWRWQVLRYLRSNLLMCKQCKQGQGSFASNINELIRVEVLGEM